MNGCSDSRRDRMMRVLVINLDRSPGRLSEFKVEAERCRLRFDRLAAIDGMALSQREVDTLTAPRFLFHPIKSGLVANYLSHRRAWQEAAAGKDRWMAIFEDDVRLADDVGDVLSAIETRDPDAGVIRLETTLRRVVVDVPSLSLLPGWALHRMRSWHGGVAAYVIHRDCARMLAAYSARASAAADQVLFHPLSPLFAKLRVHQLIPGAAVQASIFDPTGTGSGNTTTVWDQEPRSQRKVFHHPPLVGLRWQMVKGVERIKRAYESRQPGRSYRFVPFARSTRED